MAWPTDIGATGDLITAAQWNRLPEMLADSTLGAAAASFDFTGIPAHWSHLMIVAYLRGDAVTTSRAVNVRFNNDSGGNYDRQLYNAGAATVAGAEAFGATSGQVGSMPAASATADVFGTLSVIIPHYAGTVDQKACRSDYSEKRGVTTGLINMGGSCVYWRSAAAINRITLLPESGNFDIGSRASVYGMGRI